MRILAYGKLNLFFNICGTLKNGYHSIESVFQTVDLANIININLAENIQIKCDDPEIPTDQSNTCYKAIKSFCAHTKIKTGASIIIHKKIPTQAGMGGASADAAAVLTGLNKLTKANLKKEELIKIGAKIGADVPFCLTQGTALCEGIGENITSLPHFDVGEYVIVKPEHGISTAEAYIKYDKVKNTIIPPTYNIQNMIQNIERKDVIDVGYSLYNVFEQISDFNELSYIKKSIKRTGAIGTLMTGSGSAVFGIFEKSGRKAAKALSRKFKEVYHCKPLKQITNDR